MEEKSFAAIGLRGLLLFFIALATGIARAVSPAAGTTGVIRNIQYSTGGVTATTMTSHSAHLNSGSTRTLPASSTTIPASSTDSVDLSVVLIP